MMDLLIVGGGPIGLAVGLEAHQAGLRYVVLEKAALVDSIYHYPANMTFFSTSDRLEIGHIPFVSIHAKPTRPEALEYYRRVADSKRLHVNLYEKVLDIQPCTAGGFLVKTTKGEYQSANVVLATGFYGLPVLMNIPGEDLPKVTHYYQEPHPYYRQKVMVVGANNSAVDAALETWRKGAEVTMIIRGSEIGPRVKYWVRPDIENRIQEGAIKAYFSSVPTAIREHEVDVQTPDGRITLPNDYVIAATGYQPNFEFLEKTGVLLSTDGKLCPTYNPATQETNVPGLYVAGVVCGGLETQKWFIENSRAHAPLIVADVRRKMMG